MYKLFPHGNYCCPNELRAYFKYDNLFEADKRAKEFKLELICKGNDDEELINKAVSIYRWNCNDNYIVLSKTNWAEYCADEMTLKCLKSFLNKHLYTKKNYENT